MKKIITFILTLALLFAIVYSPDKVSENIRTDLEVHFIDVGQGDSILIKSEGENILIDGGKRSTSEKLISYLENQKVKDLKYIIGTHPHEDHIGGLIAVLDNFNVENIMLPNVIANTIVFEELLNSIEQEGLKIKKPTILETIDIGKGKLTILAPNSDKYSLTNNYSIVTKLVHGDKSFLFTGDAENQSEKEMLKAHKSILKADLLKLGHHGSKTSTNKEFLEAVAPEHGIISVAEKNSYNHPDIEVLESLNKKDIKMYRTDVDGNILVESDGRNLKITKNFLSSSLDKIYGQINNNFKAIRDTLLRNHFFANFRSVNDEIYYR